MDWADLLSALGLMMVLEGLMPFANPSGTRRTMAMLSQTDDGKLRIFGLISMVVGVALIYFVRF
ncbi:MAG: DUF2065 domain-containing protein [Gammaproteobacteria bacterium]